MTRDFLRDFPNYDRARGAEAKSVRNMVPREGSMKPPSRGSWKIDPRPEQMGYSILSEHVIGVIGLQDPPGKARPGIGKGSSG